MSEYIENVITNQKLKNVLSNERYLSIIKACVSLVCKRNIKISYGGKSSYTDGETIHIGILDFILKYKVKEIMYYITAVALHEAEHTVSTDFKKNYEFITSYNDEFEQKIVSYIVNSIEDGRIEYIHKKKYINNIKYINRFREIWLQEQSVKLNYEETTEEEKTEELYNELLFCVCTIATTGKMQIGFKEKYQDNLKVIDFFKVFEEKIKRVVKSKDFDDVLILTRDIFNYLIEHFEDMIAYCKKDKIKCLCVLDELRMGKDITKVCDIDLQEITIDEEFKEMDLDKEILKEISNTTANQDKIEKNYIYHANPTKSPFTQEVTVIKNQAKNLLDLKYFEEMRGLKNGSVYVKHLWKVAVGETNIMYKPKIEYKINTAIYILVDASGSMSETHLVRGERVSKMFLANRTAAIIEESLSEYINMEIAYFDGGHKVVREFNSPPNISYVWAIQRDASGSNQDYLNIEIARNKLIKTTEEKKIIIIISDGEPCGKRNGMSAEKAVRYEVNECKKENIEVIAIAIDSDIKNYESMYDNIITCNSADLKDKLVKVIMRILR